MEDLYFNPESEEMLQEVEDLINSSGICADDAMEIIQLRHSSTWTLEKEDELLKEALYCGGIIFNV